MIFWLAMAAGLLVQWGRGGRLGALGDVRFRCWGLPVAGGALHGLLRLWRGPIPGTDVEMAASLAVYACLGLFLALNLRLPGAPLVLAGMSSNCLATLAAGGRMPVWIATTGRLPAGVSSALRRGALASHVLIPHPSGLGWLGDVLAIPRPLPADVVSAGDLAIAAGILLFLALATPDARLAARRRPSS